MKRLLLLPVLCVLSLSIAFAQEPKKTFDKAERMKEIASKRLIFISKKAELTKEQTTVLEGIIEEYVKEVRTLKGKLRELHKIKKDDSNKESIDYDKMLKEIYAYKKELLELEKKYSDRLSKELSSEKAYKILNAEMLFSRVMVKGIHNRYKVKPSSERHNLKK